MPANEEVRSAAAADERELVLTRVFDAPRDLVFRAWTEPELMKQWWGPKGFTLPYCTIDLRPGGKIRFCMRSPEGADLWCGGVYQEIVRPERIVVTDYFTNEQGEIVPASHYGMAGWPEITTITVTFVEKDGKTTMTMRHSATVPLPKEHREGAQQGWGQSFDRLAELVEGAR
jgi:uncharacterized protein YndB with AHSA1/START domain